MRNDYYSNYLAHHGIKGQHWGVRNGPPYPLDSSNNSRIEKDKQKRLPKIILTDNQKKILKGIAIAAGTVGVGVGAYYVLRNTSVLQIAKLLPTMGSSGPKIEKAAKDIIKNNLKDTDVVLNKGMELYKANVDKNFDVTKTKDVIYSSYDQLDRIAYRYGLFSWRKNKDRYEAIFEATENLRGPSKETAMEIFDKLYNSNEEYRNSLLDSVAKEYMHSFRLRSGFKDLTDEQLYEKAERYAKEALENNLFKTSMGNMVSNTSTSKMLVEAFRKEGYDFVEDYIDKGTMAKNPIVLLSNDNIRQKGVNWYNYYNKSNRQLAKMLLSRKGHGGAFGWSVNDP